MNGVGTHPTVVPAATFALGILAVVQHNGGVTITGSNPWHDAIYLLGAGASIDAGLPSSVRLTRNLIARLRATRPPGMSPGQFSHMSSTLDALVRVLGEDVDFELLASAIRDFANSDVASIVPFVETWKKGIDPSDSEAFFSLDVLLGPSIRHELLTSAQPSDFGYLEPLVRLGSRPQGVTVATLNYDLGVEYQAERIGIPYDVGFDELNAGDQKIWLENGVRLLKLHGSLGWTQASAYVTPGYLAEFPFVESLDPSTDDEQPVIKFGRGNKMSATPLYLQLYVTFLNELAKHDRLVVVGYAFRDTHINQAIKDWVGKSPDRRVHIINPSVPDLKTPMLSWNQDESSIDLNAMINTFTPVFNATGHPGLLLQPGRITGTPGVGAADGLAKLLKQYRDMHV